MMTLGLEALAKEAPDVSFVHVFPGTVKTDIIRNGDGAILRTVALVFKALFFVTGYTPIAEVGERHTFYCTSARLPPRNPADPEGPSAAGVGLPDGVSVANGVDGSAGGGVYSVDTYGESADAKVEELLANYRTDGTADKLWTYTVSEHGQIFTLHFLMPYLYK